jgi:hypothetical protein
MVWRQIAIDTWKALCEGYTALVYYQGRSAYSMFRLSIRLGGLEVFHDNVDTVASGKRSAGRFFKREGII